VVVVGLRAQDSEGSERKRRGEWWRWRIWRRTEGSESPDGGVGQTRRLNDGSGERERRERAAALDVSGS